MVGLFSADFGDAPPALGEWDDGDAPPIAFGVVVAAVEGFEERKDVIGVRERI